MIAKIAIVANCVFVKLFFKVCSLVIFHAVKKKLGRKNKNIFLFFCGLVQNFRYSSIFFHC